MASSPSDARSVPLSPEDARRWTQVGTLAAFALVLSYAETFVPIPIPGVKLGLANIVVLVALVRFDARSALAIAVIKVLAAGLLFGSPIMMAYSAMGTLLAYLGMALLAKLPTMHVVMVSIVGAILHNAGQLLVAQVLLGTSLVWASAPLLFVAAIVTGALSGMLAKMALDAIPADGRMKTFELPDDNESAPYGVWASSANPVVKPDPRFAVVAFIVYTIVVLRSSGFIALGICALIAAVLLALSRVPARSAARALRPFMFVLIITFVMQVIYQQQGAVLFEVGPVAITEGALIVSAEMMVRLACLMVASVAFMGFVDAKGLIDALKWLAKPLEHVGVNMQGPILALDVALAFLPELVTDFKDLAADWQAAHPQAGRIQMLRALTPELISRSFSE